MRNEYNYNRPFLVFILYLSTLTFPLMGLFFVVSGGSKMLIFLLLSFIPIMLVAGVEFGVWKEYKVTTEDLGIKIHSAAFEKYIKYEDITETEQLLMGGLLIQYVHENKKTKRLIIPVLRISPKQLNAIQNDIDFHIMELYPDHVDS